jgi:hypothetical protein
MEDVGIFYGHLVYITAIWRILSPFVIFCGQLVHFSKFGMLQREKSGNPVWNVCFAFVHTKDSQPFRAQIWPKPYRKSHCKHSAYLQISIQRFFGERTFFSSRKKVVKKSCLLISVTRLGDSLPIGQFFFALGGFLKITVQVQIFGLIFGLLFPTVKDMH